MQKTPKLISRARFFFIIFQPPESTWKAWAMLWAGEGDGKHGEVSFRQISPVNPLLVNVNVTGLPKGRHAVHVHAFGDVRDGCKSTGPHIRGVLVSKLIEKKFIE